jgi:hypothetical protein
LSMLGVWEREKERDRKRKRKREIGLIGYL